MKKEETKEETAGGEPASAAADAGGGTDAWKAKGVALRAFFYIFGTHIFAGFVWLLFYLGQHADK